MADKKPQESGLIDAVYDLALDPNNFEQFAEEWEQFIEDNELLHMTEDELPLGISKHFGRAFQILEKIGRVGKAQSNTIEEFIENRPNSSLAVTEDGSIVASNKASRDLFDKSSKTHTLADLVHEDSMDSLAKGLIQVASTDTPLPLLVLLKQRVPALMRLQQMANVKTILIDISGSVWDHQVTNTLKAMYALTERECEVASLLYQGLTVNQIAEMENRSAETLRKHTKAVLNKTETHSQPKLMRLLTSLNFAHAGNNQPSWVNSQCANYTITLNDDRRLAYYDAAQKNEKIIVVLHGLLHDPELPPQMHDALVDAGYRIIGMSRAWYGESSPPSGTDNILERGAQDLDELLITLGISEVVLLGSMAGSIHAYVFAALRPEKVTKIINISGMVPLIDDSQLESMPKSLRAMVRTAKYFPKLFPMLIRTGVALIDNGDIRKLFESGYRSSPVDIQATQDPKIFARLSTGYRFAVHHGYSAYTYEGIAVVGDTAKYLNKVDCPIHLIHGEDDGLTGVSTVQSFCETGRNHQLHVIAGSGHLLMYTHPDLCASKVLASLQHV